MNGINDAVTIVTGASTGIGHSAALRFAEEGASVVVGSGDVDPSNAEPFYVTPEVGLVFYRALAGRAATCGRLQIQQV